MLPRAASKNLLQLSTRAISNRKVTLFNLPPPLALIRHASMEDILPLSGISVRAHFVEPLKSPKESAILKSLQMGQPLFTELPEIAKRIAERMYHEIQKDEIEGVTTITNDPLYFRDIDMQRSRDERELQEAKKQREELHEEFWKLKEASEQTTKVWKKQQKEIRELQEASERAEEKSMELESKQGEIQELQEASERIEEKLKELEGKQGEIQELQEASERAKEVSERAEEKLKELEGKILNTEDIFNLAELYTAMNKLSERAEWGDRNYDSKLDKLSNEDKVRISAKLTARDIRNKLAHHLDLKSCLRIVEKDPAWEQVFQIVFGLSSTEAKDFQQLDKSYKFCVVDILEAHAQVWKFVAANEFLAPFDQWLDAIRNLPVQCGQRLPEIDCTIVSSLETLAIKTRDAAKVDMEFAPLHGRGLKEDRFDCWSGMKSNLEKIGSLQFLIEWKDLFKRKRQG